MNDLRSQLYNPIQAIMNRMVKHLDEHIEKALLLKGYEFSSSIDLQKFVKEHCRKEEKGFMGDQIFFVKDIPFLCYKHSLYNKVVERVTEKGEKQFLVEGAEITYL